jgi:hypothetical protein
VSKWENCLDPSEDIKSLDRTYKLIKERLLKAVIERSKKLEMFPDDPSAVILDQEDLPPEDEWDPP